ncbi:MAG: DUF4293 domain-containing protein [Bacteroidota bacterium]
MIQRIQSIYLFLASGALFGLFALPVATTEKERENSELFADAKFNLFDELPILAIVALAGAVLLVTIFLYNNRKLQMNLTKVGVLLVIGACLFGGYTYWGDSAKSVAEPAVGVALPVLALIFAWLAHRGIKSDEKLVQSMDRLR